MVTHHRTKQVSVRLPLPLLSQIKSQADTKQQAIADWILEVVSRELQSSDTDDQVQEKSAEPTPFFLHPELLSYVESCISPLHLQINELRTKLGESKAWLSKGNSVRLNILFLMEKLIKAKMIKDLLHLLNHYLIH